MSGTDIVEQLRALATSMDDGSSGGAAKTIRDAADEIEFLRQHAGAITRGKSFVEIANEAPKRTVVEGGS